MLFVGLVSIAVVEAKRQHKNVSDVVGQAERYSKGFRLTDGMVPPGGPWGDFHVPFVFATNGRRFHRQFLIGSGIWFRDARRPTNLSRPPVEQFDCIVVEECHRGYLLDQEMGEEELAFRDMDDYVSKYRQVLDRLDAVTVGLTATPALHTTQIFGPPVFQYAYREAVVDGWLVDHDTPLSPRTRLKVAGIA